MSSVADSDGCNQRQRVVYLKGIMMFEYGYGKVDHLMKKFAITFSILLFVASLFSVSVLAETVDTFADLPNRTYILTETVDWSKTQSTELTIDVECAEQKWHAVGYDILEATVKQGSTATLTNAVFNCIKNGRYVITDRDVVTYCQIYVPASSDASLVSIDGNSIHFEKGGDVSIIVKYAYANLLQMSIKQPSISVRFDFHIEDSDDVSLRLLNPETKEEIESLSYACGSFVFDAQDCSKLLLEYTIKEETEAEACNIVLPEGFSFKEYELDDDWTLDEIGFDASGICKDEILIYPIYCSEMPQNLRFSVEGDAEGCLDISVDKVENEGVVLCRNTQGVSLVEEAIPIEIKTFVDFSDDFSTEPEEFSNRLNELGCALAFSVYVEDFMEDSFENLGFTKVKCYDSETDHEVGGAFAQKKVILDDGTIKNLLMVVIRGTLDTEWIGNFVVAEDGELKDEHADFRNAADYVMEQFEVYCDNYGVKPEMRSNTQAFICGHSRGAAVSNLFVHDLSVSNEYVYQMRGYAFATPNSTKNPVAYPYLHNYVFLHDLVGFVPAGYVKHGQTYVVGLKDGLIGEPEEVGSLFKQYSAGAAYRLPNQPLCIGLIEHSGEEIINKFISRKDISDKIGYMVAREMDPTNNDMAQGHGAEGYLAWVNGNGVKDYINFSEAKKYYSQVANRVIRDLWTKIFCARNDLDTSSAAYLSLYNQYLQSERGGANFIEINCPVDVLLKDANGNTVASFRSHIVEQIDNDYALTFSIGQSDYLLLPADLQLSVWINPIEDGSMTVCMTQIGEDQSDDYETVETEVVQQVSYSNLKLEQDKAWQIQLFPAGSSEISALYDPEGNLCTSDSIFNSVYFPKNLTVIEAEAYMDTLEMTGAYICPESLVSIGARAFSGSGISGIYIPENCRSIGEDAFDGISPVLYCVEGSFAHEYAVENDMEFVLVSALGE